MSEQLSSPIELVVKATAKTTITKSLIMTGIVESYGLVHEINEDAIASISDDDTNEQHVLLGFLKVSEIDLKTVQSLKELMDTPAAGILKGEVPVVIGTIGEEKPTIFWESGILLELFGRESLDGYYEREIRLELLQTA